MNSSSSWTRYHALALLVLLAVLFLLPLNATRVFDEPNPKTWLIELAVLAAILGLVGHGVTGRFAGFMIDGRNRMSLSQLQVVLWTVILLSAYLTAVVARIRAGVVEPLALAMDPDLWWLMGISLTSLVGTPLVLSGKKKQHPDARERRETVTEIAQRRGEPSEDEVFEGIESDSQGLVLRNGSPEEARIAELFTGDETGNGGAVDLGKIQMLLFTLVLAFAYATSLARSFDTLISGGEFPGLHDSMVALLGISHAGYLAYKTAPHSHTSPAPPGDPENPVPRGSREPLRP